jgi:hypothetical protein
MVQIIQNGFHGGTPGVRLEKLQSDKDVLFHPVFFRRIADFRIQQLAPSQKRDGGMCSNLDFVCFLFRRDENNRLCTTTQDVSISFMQIVTC